MKQTDLNQILPAGTDGTRFIPLAGLFVLVLLILPVLLSSLGVDLGLKSNPADFDLFAQMTASERMTAAHLVLRPSFVHILLEWSSVIVSLAALIICLIHFLVSRGEFLAVLAVALVVGTMTETYHSLASCYLAPAASNQAILIPFSWMLGRFFQASAIVAAIIFFVLPRHRKLSPVREKLHFGSILCLGVIMAAMAFFVMDFCVSALTLPDYQHHEALLKRPLEIAPFLLFFGSFVFLMIVVKKRDYYFFQILILYLVLNVGIQLYMAFGSAAVHDHYFNCAHLLKVASGLLIFLSIIYRYHLVSLRTIEMVRCLEEESGKSRETARQAKLLARELSEFSFVISHDLKTPIRGIQFLAEWFMDDFKERMQEPERETIRKIVERAERMSRLIDGLLEYSEIGQRKHNLEKVNLNTLVRSCAEKLMPPANVIIKYESAFPVIYGDPRSMEIVFTQLLKNAFLYADPYEGLVTVSCREESSFWVIGLSDNGGGIEKEDYDKIFRMFVSLDNESEKKTGMGLALVKKAVESFHGKVWVESVPDLGTTFFFTIPKDIAGSILD